MGYSRISSCRAAILAVCLSLNTAGVVAQEPLRFHEDISELTDAGEYGRMRQNRKTRKPGLEVAVPN